MQRQPLIPTSLLHAVSPQDQHHAKHSGMGKSQKAASMSINLACKQTHECSHLGDQVAQL